MHGIVYGMATALATALVGQALRETEARYSVIAQFIDDRDRAGSHTSAWNDALREFHVLHGRRSGLVRRQSLIQEALECPVGKDPANVPPPPSPNRPVPRTQQQVQVQV